MKRHLIIAGAVSGLVAFSLATGTADAHNAAHFFLPDGTCHDVGSNKEAPIVGAANPNQSRIYNLPGQLDLIPETNGDQYGARWAANHSPTLLPGNCP